MHRQSRLKPESAFVIHQRAYRETSLLVEVFTRGYGRLGLVARGAKRAKSPLRHILQAFQPLVIRWSGRGELGTLIHAENREVTGLLPGRAVLSGLYLNELMLRLTHRYDPHADLFDAYEIAIMALRRREQMENTLRIFEKHLLQTTGYGLVLDHEAHTGEVLKPHLRYIYEPEVGPVRAVAEDRAGISVSGRTLLALAREEELDRECLREAKHLMRCVLQQHMGDRQLQSRKLFQTIHNPGIAEA